MLNKPLAFRMRPKTLSDVLGQEKIKSFLQSIIDNNTLVSMILYGPPGCGKTTIAEAFALTCNYHCIKLNATIDNKQVMESAFKEAINFGPSIIILDEIHRMDKGKQDILLPHLERGDFFLIGCTTANPFISLNPAIRSRCRLLEATPLSVYDITKGLNRALNSEDGLIPHREFESDAISYISNVSGGDLRFAYNQLESIALSFPSTHKITKEDAKSIIVSPNFFADSNSDEHYNTISALQKSIRGSQVDAALYYLAKLIKSGDLEGICRRLQVTAYEDIGLANPAAVDRCKNAIDAAISVGLPEGKIPLAFSVIDLSLSPKSKSAEAAIDSALSCVDDKPIQVRDYLKLTTANTDPSTTYPYDDPLVWKYIQYLPDELIGKVFFKANDSGKYERALEEYRKANEVERVCDIIEAKKRAHKK